MKLLKPNWIHHDGKPIFSVDVHQEYLKFATGGQGQDSGRVVIWNLLPVVSEKAELDDSVPKVLCQLDSHLACVNCVRWSENGKLLASGSDDKLVMIWRMQKGSSGVFGNGGMQQNPESWKCIATLRGHSGDVLDLAWSPQDRWLASCSVDNTIIVWDVHSFPLMVAVLKGHTGLVKGVAWDPVGKFLASQSDDRSVKIWKTSDWSCSNTITEPFEECSGTTHILRLSWSPDGQYLVSAHAMNGGGPTAQIIEREGWKCDKDFVGHRKAVTCVRFHNSILSHQASSTAKPHKYCCLAVGSRDRSLSVWMTALQRPLVVIHDLFNDSILDLSWGLGKCILMACSGDGTVACLQFSPTELGTPLQEEDKNSLYQRIYGKSITIENGSSGSNADILIENAELLNVSQEPPKPPALPITTMMVTNNANNNNSFLKSATSTTLPSITTSVTTNGFSNHAAVAVNSPGGAGGGAEGVNAAITSTASNEFLSPAKAIGKQMETRTADGKRRITPVFIPLNEDANENPSLVLSSSSRPIATETTTNNTTTIPTATATTAATTVRLNAESISGTVSKPPITEAEQIRLDTRLIKGSNAPMVQPNQANIKNVSTYPHTASITATTTATIGNRSNATPTPTTSAYMASTTGPKINITVNTKCEFQKTALNLRVHVHNGYVQTAMGLLCKVTAYALTFNEKLWELFVGSPIVNLNFCTKYVMLCCLDGTMRLLDMPTGIAILPIITLSGAAIQCAFCPLGKLVGIITDCGMLRIWNIEEQRVTLATTCSEIFGKFGAVIQFNISEQGVPLVLFANGNSYTYSEQLKSWLVLNTKDPIMRHGLLSTVPKEFQKNYRNYPLTSVQATTHSFASGGGIELNSHEWQSSAKISFIENQIKLCEIINSPDELKHWYTMLAYHLAMSGTEQRLRLLLDNLFGTIAIGCSMAVTSDKILSIPKHVLLLDILNVLKSHAKWQRIYREYLELFENSRNMANSTDHSSKMANTIAKTTAAAHNKIPELNVDDKTHEAIMDSDAQQKQQQQDNCMDTD